MAKIKDSDLQLILVGVVILVLLVKGPSFISGYGFGSTVIPDIVLQLDQEDFSYDIDLSVSPSKICAGDSATGKIESNILNGGHCSIYVDTGTGFTPFANINLDAFGNYEETVTISTVGQAIFKAACCDAFGKCRVSNAATLTVEACGKPYVCCLISKTQYSCVPGSICPGGISPIKQYGSFADCNANCKAPVIPPPCSDTDGGDDVWNYGECTDSDGTTADICPLGNFEDFVSEAYCSGGVCAGASYSCNALGASCYNGECIPWNQDSDGDGWSDLDELEQGSDPNDAGSTPGGAPNCFAECTALQFQFGNYLPGVDMAGCHAYAEVQCMSLPPVGTWHVTDFYYTGECCCWWCDIPI